MPFREDILNPIPGENPGGADLRYDPVYDKIKEARREDDNLDPLCARPLGNPGARGLATARPRVDQQHWPARRLRGPPAITCQLSR